jgi:hypothetical protein
MPPYKEVQDLRTLLLAALERIVQNYALQAAQAIACQSSRCSSCEELKEQGVDMTGDGGHKRLILQKLREHVS